jgi:hypothetical protein
MYIFQLFSEPDKNYEIRPQLIFIWKVVLPRAERKRNMREAIELHLEGYEIPEPRNYSSYIEVAT